MADEVDRTQDRAEHDYLANVARSRKPSGPLPNGRCHWCDEIVPDNRRWCEDNDCNVMWEKYK